VCVQAVFWKENTGDPATKLMMLPSDMVLLADDKFKIYVEQYAKNQKLWYADFAKAFQKLEELGTTNLKG